MPLVLKAEPRVALELSAAEQRIYDAYRQAFAGIGDINDSRVLRAIEDAINANNPLGAVNAVAWGDFAASLQNTVDALNKEVIKAANDSARSLPTSVRIAANFTTADPRAIAFAQQRAGKLIRQVSDESRKAVTETVMEALRMRIDRREMVTRISKVVGLDSRQARALTRFYEKSLVDGRAAGLDYEEALAKADRLGDKYKKRLIRQRAVRIARTETVAASNAGRYLSWIEADAQGLLGSTSVKRWITAMDERTCPICAPLNNKEVPYKTNFSTGDLMPPVHPNCRCSAVIIPAEVSFIPLEKAVVSSDPIAAMFKHGSHDQSRHNPHKGGNKEVVLEEGVGYSAKDKHIVRNPETDEGYLEHYTGTASAPLNQWYRRRVWDENNEAFIKKEDVPAFQTEIDSFLNETSAPREMTLYRGVGQSGYEKFAPMKVGNSFVDKGYASTTTDPSQLWDFMSTKEGSRGAVLEITVPKGSRVLSVPKFFQGTSRAYSPADEILNENEHILPRGTTFLITSIATTRASFNSQ